MINDSFIRLPSDFALRAHWEACSINGGAISIGSQFSVGVSFHRTIDRVSVALIEQLHRRRGIRRFRVSDHLLRLECASLAGVSVSDCGNIISDLAFGKGDSSVKSS